MNKKQIRIARVSDLIREEWSLDQIVKSFVDINNEIWGGLVPEEDIWTEDMVIKQFQRCPQLQYCAIIDNEIVATLNMIYIKESSAIKCTSWRQISGRGTFSTHQDDGDCVFGIDLAISRKYQGYKISDEIMTKAFYISVIAANKKGAFLGSRAPSFSKNSHRRTIEDHVFGKKRNGKTLDPEIRLYQSEGFELVKIIPNYIEDPESCDYGVLMFWKNPFYKFTRFIPLKIFMPLVVKRLL